MSRDDPLKERLRPDGRRNETPAEKRLWMVLRANRTGFHFRRQEWIGGFLVDFCCFAARLVVEVDGGVHDSRVEADRARDAVLTGLGFFVLRIPNEDVLNDLRPTRTRIARLCRDRIDDPPVPEGVKRAHR